MITKGRICMKTAGRDTGLCVVLEKKEGKVRIAGPEVRERWVSPAHLIPFSKKLATKLTKAQMLKELKEFKQEFDQTQLDRLDVLATKAQSRTKG